MMSLIKHRKGLMIILRKLMELLRAELVIRFAIPCRHFAYHHSDRANKFPCADCDNTFSFVSQLKSHRKVHRKALEHHCLRCNKSYKNKGELVNHQSIHSGKTWRCQVEYTCSDLRNLRAHMHKHGRSDRYQCKQCNKTFQYYIQFKHYGNCKQVVTT